MGAFGEEKVEHTTAMALQEKAKLQKTFRRFDMLFFSICALVGLDTLGEVSSWGVATFTWVAILAVIFLLPYALVMSELGSAFTQEGGPYEWMKLSWGRFAAGVGSVLYWVTNPLWVGGTLAFAATSAWSVHIHAVGSRSVGDYLFKIAFIWISIGVAIVSLRYGKWIPNVGAIVRVSVLAFFSITVLIYAVKHGVNGPSFSHPFAAPGTSAVVVFLGLVPLLLFNYVGFELQNGAAEEMIDPQKDVPRTVIGSGIVTVLAYAIPIFGIVFVLPSSKITGISGLMDAVGKTFTVYGSAGHFLTQVMAIGFIIALVTSGAVWMIGSDRIQAVAAYDGAAPGFFGVFNAKLGTPVRVNVLSGVVSTIFMFAAQRLHSSNTFLVVLFLATSTTLISYLLIFPAGIRLRMSHGHVNRPYRLGRIGNGWMWVCSMVCLAWMLLGSWVALFPGLIEEATGHSYSMHDAYGVSRIRFEVFTLGSLTVIIAFAVLGYVLGAPVRRRVADVSLEPGLEPATGD
jgi:amino acid transporter